MTRLHKLRRALLAAGGRGVMNNGQCGDNVYYTLYQDGTLELTGSGATWDFTATEHPTWYEHKNNIINVEVANDITTLGNTMFYNCSNLVDCVCLGVETLGSNVFESCHNMQNLYCSNSLTKINSRIFRLTSGIKNIFFNGNIQEWCNISKYSNTGPFDCNYNLFINNVLQENVICPNTLQNASFQNCYSVKTVDFSSATKTAGLTFLDCPNLESINWSGIKEIGDKVITNDSKITEIELPNTITKLSVRAFNNVPNLAKVTFNSVPTSLATSAFQGCNNLLDIFVPWEENAVANAPWGATNATIHYNWTGESN